MKKYLLIAVALMIGAGIAFGVAKGDAKTLHVNDIGADPTAFTGTITVTGLIGGFSQNDRTIFGLVDLKELKCSSPNCNKIIIPVRHRGEQPKVGDEIKVTGSFVTEPGGFMFEAQKVKVVKHHKIGG